MNWNIEGPDTLLVEMLVQGLEAEVKRLRIEVTDLRSLTRDDELLRAAEQLGIDTRPPG